MGFPGQKFLGFPGNPCSRALPGAQSPTQSTWAELPAPSPGAPLGPGLLQTQRKEIQERQNPLIPPKPFLIQLPLGEGTDPQSLQQLQTSIPLLSHKEFQCCSTSTSIQTEGKLGRGCVQFLAQHLGSRGHPLPAPPSCQDTRECQEKHSNSLCLLKYRGSTVKSLFFSYFHRS